jgi:hypothetical protein
LLKPPIVPRVEASWGPSVTTTHRDLEWQRGHSHNRTTPAYTRRPRPCGAGHSPDSVYGCQERPHSRTPARDGPRPGACGARAPRPLSTHQALRHIRGSARRRKRDPPALGSSGDPRASTGAAAQRGASTRGFGHVALRRGHRARQRQTNSSAEKKRSRHERRRARHAAPSTWRPAFSPAPAAGCWCSGRRAARSASARAVGTAHGRAPGMRQRWPAAAHGT